MWHRLARMYATVFGLGHVIYPGLFGAICGAVLAYFLMPLGWQTRLLVTILIFIFAIPSATIAERHHGHKDPKHVIIDEVLGVQIATLTVWYNPYLFLLGIFFFLVFDLFKPWPANWFENNLPGGWGIVMDDIAAGVYAWILVFLIQSTGILI